jgi:hypothetical protein
LSDNKNVKSIKDTIKDFIYIDLFPSRTGVSDVVSSNTKVVLYGLFALVGFAILTYATIVSGHNYNSTGMNDTQKVKVFEQLEQVNTVFIAAVSGSLALGGTLIAQLWGRG